MRLLSDKQCACFPHMQDLCAKIPFKNVHYVNHPAQTRL